MIGIKRFFKHLHTVNKHRRVVKKLCFKVGLIKQGLVHDLSKYSFVEFWNGVKYFDGHKSPHVYERIYKGYSDAWMHHKGRNKHHMDYWTDINYKTGMTEPVEMPKKYYAEMLCDRIAAAKIYNGKNYTDSKPLDYFLRTRHENICHPKTDANIETHLRYLAENGENAFVKMMKNYLKNK